MSRDDLAASMLSRAAYFVGAGLYVTIYANMNSRKSDKFLIGTLLVKIFFLIALFAGIPYVLVSLSNRYQQKAEGIIDQERAVVEIQTEKTQQMKVLTQAEANTLSKIGDFISGTWVSEADGRYVIQVDPDNKFSEYYDASKEGFGVWRVFTGSPDQVDLSGSPEIADGSGLNDGASAAALSATAASPATSSAYTKSQFDNAAPEESKYFFQKQQYEPGHKGEKYVYQIQQLDTDKFILVYKGGTGRPLVFVRATSTPAVSAN